MAVNSREELNAGVFENETIDIITINQRFF